MSDTLSFFSPHPCSCTLGPCSICTSRKERPFWGVLGEGVGRAALGIRDWEEGAAARCLPCLPILCCQARCCRCHEAISAGIRDSPQRSYLGGASPHLPWTSSPWASVQLRAQQLPPSPRGLAPFRVAMNCSDTCVTSVILLDLDDNREFKWELPYFSMGTTQPGPNPSLPHSLAPQEKYLRAIPTPNTS